MSAKIAAAALIQFDVDAAAMLPTSGEVLDDVGAIALGKALRRTWTLSLAAAAAGVSEQQVVAAVLQHHTRCGTSLVCQGYA
ncbi:hypothetical protein ACFOHT_03050 [Massilia oculi]|uniref:hypothetical protein n=1 Tax=Massilia oculi TaxID=945844 RepID=UPI0013B37138|nr:hypothetical protein [Massilia oculi]